jgi:hypothetical protein
LEKKEKYVQLISEWYDEEFFTTKLGIAPDYVNGFKYYLVENENFLQVLESKNNQKTILFMVALSQEYKIALNHGN